MNIAADGDPIVDGHSAVDHIPAVRPCGHAAFHHSDIICCLFIAVFVQIGYTIYKSVCLACKKGKQVVQLLRAGDFGFLLLGQLLIGCMGCLQFFINRLLFLGSHRFHFFHCGQSVHQLLNRLHLFVRFFAFALAQICIFCAAHRTVGVDCFCGAKRFAAAHWLDRLAVVLWVADFTNEGTGCPRRGGGIAASLVVFVLAVQLFCDTAVFFAAFMGTRSRLSIFRIGRGSCVVRYAFHWVALVCMFMDALGNKGIAVLIVFMDTGCSLCVAAVGCVLRVVFA